MQGKWQQRWGSCLGQEVGRLVPTFLVPQSIHSDMLTHIHRFKHTEHLETQ